MKKITEIFNLIITVLWVSFYVSCGGIDDNPVSEPAEITYHVTQAGGVANSHNTTGIEFTFSESIDELNISKANITIGGAAIMGQAAFTGEDVNWTLFPVQIKQSGLATVKIKQDGIEWRIKQVEVFKKNQEAAEYWNIEWHLNGGVSDKTYPTQITKYSILDKPDPNPSQDNYYFNGWHTSEKLDSEYNFANPVTGNLNLYAGWTQKSPDNNEPAWLPDSLQRLHPANGTWSRNYGPSENIYHTNFTAANSFVDELITVNKPGNTGTAGVPAGSSYGAVYSYFASSSISAENAVNIVRAAQTAADGFYAELLAVQKYLDEKGNIRYSFRQDNTMNAAVYEPYATLSEVSSRLWIYAMDNGTVCITARGTVKHGSVEKTYLNAEITVDAEKWIGYKSGYIYTFTPDDGGAPDIRDLRTETYFDE